MSACARRNCRPPSARFASESLVCSPVFLTSPTRSAPALPSTASASTSKAAARPRCAPCRRSWPGDFRRARRTFSRCAPRGGTWGAAPAVRPRPLRGFFQYAAAWLKPSCTGDEFRGNRQLVRRQPQGFLSRRFIHSRHLEHDASRFHHRHPLFRRAFALAHARFGRLLGERLVRENPDPQFPAALDEPRNRHARRFDLPVGDPCAFHGFQTVLAERQISAAPGFAVAAAAHLLSVLHFLWHQHRCVLASLISLTASRLQLNALLFFVYTTAAVSRSF